MLRAFFGRVYARFVAWWHQDDPPIPPVSADMGDD